MLPTDLTVAAVVERDDHYLIVEERASGVIVFTQPGGHIETGESPEDACLREVLEETACEVTIECLLDVYLWIHPQTRQQFLRIIYIAQLLQEQVSDTLDDGIHAVHWMTFDDIKRKQRELRTPVVTRCIEDYLAGKRQPATMLAGSMPITQRVADVLASAALV